MHIYRMDILLLICMLVVIGHNYKVALGCFEKEKIGLLKLKDFINNHNRSISPTWGDKEHEQDCCRWEGVICSDDAFSKRIINLSLSIIDDDTFISTQNLDDWFLDALLFQPFEQLQNLTFHDPTETFLGFKGRLRHAKLQVLDLSYNPAMSRVPFMGELPSLKFLDLSANSISDFQELTSLRSNLELLKLGLNSIEGQIPPSIWALTSLKMLELSENYLNGSLPEGFCALTNLEELDLSYNAFEGVLPTCLSNFTSLRLLEISRNKFSGSIPPNLFYGLKSLQYVSLSHNLFGGLFSFKSLENNSKIEVFQLANNKNNPMLKVETENTKWKPHLKIFVVGYCILNEQSGGIIPSFLLTQHDLRVVDLNSNGINGEFPTWLLTNNSRLEHLRLVNNSFNGPLRLQLGSYNAYMLWFDISRNQVTGEIPSYIGSILPNLYFLDMSINAIEGSIPSSIGNMTKLTALDLSNNHIYGVIPVDLFYGCKKLRILKLFNNNFTNFSPMKSQRLPLELLELDIGYNSFTGRFPDLITNFSSLRILVMSNNQFEGKLPDAFCKLKYLQNLDLSWNKFVDTLPTCIQLTDLSFLHLQGNRFRGPLPTFLSRSSSLAVLDMSFNKFSGLIPAWISSFQDLTFLLLRGNIFHGSIPSQLCHMKNINILDLAGNNFTESIPPCLFHLPIGKSERLDAILILVDTISKARMPFYRFSYESKLSQKYVEDGFDGIPFYDENVQFMTKSMSRSYKLYIDVNGLKGDIDEWNFMSGVDLSLNKLTGPISLDIDNWKNVHSLNLLNNHLNGSIPWTLSRFKNLESLDLSHNMLSGKIPSELIKLTSLSVFSVAYNNLSGQTPTYSNQFGIFDSKSYEGNPLLCGLPLDKSCITKDVPHTKPIVEPEQNDSSFQTHFLWSFFGSFVGSCIGAFVFFFFVSNFPQMFLRWVGVGERLPRRRTIELPEVGERVPRKRIVELSWW